MKTNLIWIFVILIFASCTKVEEQTIWISGFKTECSMGAGKGECLYISKNADLDKAEWEYFYSPIEDFAYEAGFLQKIKVRVETRNENPAPQDQSKYQYTKVEVLERIADNRVQLEGSWILVKMDDNPIDRSKVLPTINFDWNAMRIFGKDGCNDYHARIVASSNSKLKVDMGATTQKMCVDMAMPDAYNKHIMEVRGYKLEKGMLNLLNDEGKVLLSYIKENLESQNANLAGKWTTVRLDGGKINKMVKAPTFNIDPRKEVVWGNDGCNDYRGGIKVLGRNEMELANLAVTEKACKNMDVAMQFIKALTETRKINMDKSMLLLYDAEGKERVALLKAKEEPKSE